MVMSFSRVFDFSVPSSQVDLLFLFYFSRLRRLGLSLESPFEPIRGPPITIIYQPLPAHLWSEDSRISCLKTLHFYSLLSLAFGFIPPLAADDLWHFSSLACFDRPASLREAASLGSL